MFTEEQVSNVLTWCRSGGSTELWQLQFLVLFGVAAGKIHIHRQTSLGLCLAAFHTRLQDTKRRHTWSWACRQRKRSRNTRTRKKKRKRESNKTTNDVLDKDKRSNKIYQTGLDNDGFCSKNVRLLEMNDAPSAVAFEKSLVTIDRVQANSSRSEQPLDSLSHEPALYSKESNGTVDSELPLILARPAGASNGVVASAVAPSSRCLLGDDDSLNWQRHTQFMPEVERVWSAVDDQEWLFLHNNELHLKPKAKVEVDGSSQVWTEALFLPSVGMYALPYVVPY